MTKNRFSKPVAFNHTNPKDQLILQHVKRRNFSGYVKKLILEDMKAKKGIDIDKMYSPFTEIESVFSPFKDEPKEETASERLERIKKERGI